MRPLAKLTAEHLNGQPSGPKTAAGKQRSSQNALRHGITSSQLVLPWEKVEDWREGQHDDLVFAVALAAWLGEKTLPSLHDPPPRPAFTRNIPW